jgi:hypothetical protein
MTYKDTEALIQKYLNGETTTEEERLLAIEVSREDVPDDWKVIAEMLGCLTVDEALFDQIMAERKRKSRIARLWPWVAAACVAALLIVFLTPPKKDVPTQPQIAKVETGQKKKPLPKPLPREGNKKPTLNPSRRENPNPNPIPGLCPPTRSLSRKVGRIKSLPPHGRLEGGSYGSEEPTEPVTEKNTLRPVEEGDVIPFEDPMVQFAEQARALRERGNRVIHRVSMNSNPINNNTLNDI